MNTNTGYFRTILLPETGNGKTGVIVIVSFSYNSTADNAVFVFYLRTLSPEEDLPSTWLDRRRRSVMTFRFKANIIIYYCRFEIYYKIHGFTIMPAYLYGGELSVYLSIDVSDGGRRRLCIYYFSILPPQRVRPRK